MISGGGRRVGDVSHLSVCMELIDQANLAHDARGHEKAECTSVIAPLSKALRYGWCFI